MASDLSAKFAGLPTLDLFDPEPHRVELPPAQARTPRPRRVGSAGCPGCYATVAIDPDGDHYKLREHEIVYQNGTRAACSRSGMALCDIWPEVDPEKPHRTCPCRRPAGD